MFPLICTALNPKSILLSEHLLAPNKVTRGKVATISIPLVLLNFFLLKFFTVFFFFTLNRALVCWFFFFYHKWRHRGLPKPLGKAQGSSAGRICCEGTLSWCQSHPPPSVQQGRWDGFSCLEKPHLGVQSNNTAPGDWTSAGLQGLTWGISVLFQLVIIRHGPGWKFPPSALNLASLEKAPCSEEPLITHCREILPLYAFIPNPFTKPFSAPVLLSCL